jgi:hypothetical protein
MLRSLFAASLAWAAAAPVAAQPTEFYSAWSAQDKFAWAQYNYAEFCPIPKSRDIQFKDIPGWMQAGLAFATEDMVVNGIKESCGKDLDASTAAAYARSQGLQ